jgi:hypothetical protein
MASRGALAATGSHTYLPRRPLDILALRPFPLKFVHRYLIAYSTMGSLASSNPLSNDVVLIVVPAQANQEWIDRVKAKYPGITVRWEYLAIGGPKTTEDLPADIWDGVTIYSGFVTGPSAGMDKVRFIQLPSAGADRWLDHHLYKNRPDVVFSTANGVHP